MLQNMAAIVSTVQDLFQNGDFNGDAERYGHSLFHSLSYTHPLALSLSSSPSLSHRRPPARAGPRPAG